MKKRIFICVLALSFCISALTAAIEYSRLSAAAQEVMHSMPVSATAQAQGSEAETEAEEESGITSGLHGWSVDTLIAVGFAICLSLISMFIEWKTTGTISPNRGGYCGR